MKTFSQKYGERAFREQPKLAQRFCIECKGWNTAQYESPFIENPITGEHFGVFSFDDIQLETTRWCESHNLGCYLELTSWGHYQARIVSRDAGGEIHSRWADTPAMALLYGCLTANADLKRFMAKQPSFLYPRHAAGK